MAAATAAATGASGTCLDRLRAQQQELSRVRCNADNFRSELAQLRALVGGLEQQKKVSSSSRDLSSVPLPPPSAAPSTEAGASSHHQKSSKINDSLTPASLRHSASPLPPPAAASLQASSSSSLDDFCDDIAIRNNINGKVLAAAAIGRVTGGNTVDRSSAAAAASSPFSSQSMKGHTKEDEERRREWFEKELLIANARAALLEREAQAAAVAHEVQIQSLIQSLKEQRKEIRELKLALEGASAKIVELMGEEGEMEEQWEGEDRKGGHYHDQPSCLRSSVNKVKVKSKQPSREGVAKRAVSASSPSSFPQPAAGAVRPGPRQRNSSFVTPSSAAAGAVVVGENHLEGPATSTAAISSKRRRRKRQPVSVPSPSNGESSHIGPPTDQHVSSRLTKATSSFLNKSLSSLYLRQRYHSTGNRSRPTTRDCLLHLAR